MKLFLAVVFTITLCCCKQRSRQVEKALYYWKSNFNLTSFEKERLDSLHVQAFYIKFFDVAWDAVIQQALPVAKISIRDTAYLRSKKIIPTVFITNETFYRLDSARIKTLAQNMASLIKKYKDLYQLKGFDEVQMDCDWTATTKNKYFYFLTQMDTLHTAPVLSATIRLHQVKYTASSGIPPIHKGLLMCYNMGNLQDTKSQNSIIHPDEFKKYQSFINTYPLPLDVGLPLFDWYVLFRNDKYSGLFLSITPAVLSTFKKNSAFQFEVLKDTLIEGRLLKAGDLLRYENSDIKNVQKVAKHLNKTLTEKSLRVVLYHCDSVILSKYSLHDLESLYSGMRSY